MAKKNFSNLFNINEIDISELTSKYFFEKDTALELQKGRPYFKPEEVLQNEKLQRKINSKELFTLMASFHVSFPDSRPLILKGNDESKSIDGFVFGIKEFSNNSRRVFLADKFNNEIISGELDKKNTINPASIWILSKKPWELLHLHPDSREEIYEFIVKIKTDTLKRLWSIELKKRDSDLNKATSYFSFN